jgi:protein transport protein SEC24
MPPPATHYADPSAGMGAPPPAQPYHPPPPPGAGAPPPPTSGLHSYPGEPLAQGAYGSPAVAGPPGAPSPTYASMQATGSAQPQAPQFGGDQTMSAAYRAQQQQQQAQDEQPKAHFVTLTRASSTTSRIMNHESIPRPTLDADRVPEATTKRAVAFAPYVVPAASNYVRLTCPVIPNTPQLADKFGLPLAYSVSPLAPGPPIPVVNFGDLPGGGTTIVRCRRCRAYINPFCPFVDGGRRWQCSVCRGLNDTPAAYYCQVDPQRNVRLDVDKRPELCHAVCDFIAPADYLTRPPQRPSFVVVLDVSYAAAQNGLIRQTCIGVTDALWKLKTAAEAEGATEETKEAFDSLQVGFVAFDSVMYLFNLRSSLSAPKMIVAPDLTTDIAAISEKTGLQDSLELPVMVDDLLVSAKDSFELITTLLEKLPAMFEGTANAECAFGPAIQTAMTILNPTGGKLVATIAGCPSLGEGRLQSRDDPKMTHQPKEHTLTIPGTDWYKQRALACSNAHISCDIISFPTHSIDLASIVPLARYTGGHVIVGTNTNRTVLHRDVERCFTRTFGFEAVFRIRNPPQLGTVNFFGHFYVRGNDMLALPHRGQRRELHDPVQPADIPERSTVRTDRAAVHQSGPRAAHPRADLLHRVFAEPRSGVQQRERAGHRRRAREERRRLFRLEQLPGVRRCYERQARKEPANVQVDDPGGWALDRHPHPTARAAHAAGLHQRVPTLPRDALFDRPRHSA